MAISLGATITNTGNLTYGSQSTAAHTCDANTKCLVVVATGYDASATDLAVSGVTYGGTALSKAKEYVSMGYGLISVWYLSNPTTGSSANIIVTHGGTCTDRQFTAVNLVSATATKILLDSTDDGANTGSASVQITARTGAYAVGGGVAKGGSPANLSVSAGAEVTGSEVDMGGETASVGTAAESSGTCTITWAYTGAAVYAAGASFYENNAPTVALSTPTDTQTISDTNPDLVFTGTDANADPVSYEVQVDTTNTFNSQGTTPLISALSTDLTGFTADADGIYSSGTQVTYTVQSALDPGTYYWRVRAKDPAGSNTYGDWSSTYSFTISAGSTRRRNFPLWI